MLWFGAPALVLTYPISRSAWPLVVSTSVAIVLLTLWMWPGVLKTKPVSVGRGAVIGGLIPALALAGPPIVALLVLIPLSRGDDNLGLGILALVGGLCCLGGLVAAVPGAIAGAILAARARA